MDRCLLASYTRLCDGGTTQVFSNPMAKLTRRQFIKSSLKMTVGAVIGRLLWPHLAFLHSGGFVTALWCGALKSNSVRFKARIDHASTTVRMHLSTHPDLTDAFISGYQTANSTNHYIIDLTAVSLQPNTQYYYGVESNGTLDMSHIGRFKTPGNGPYSFSFAFASCAATDSNHEVFEAIDNAQPLFFMHLGDMHYRDFAENNTNPYRYGYSQIFASPRQAQLYRSRAIVYVWDDHDYGPNDSDATSPSREAARIVYRQYVPSYPLPAGSGDAAIYQAFTIGRVRFILTDLRSERSPKLDTDNAGKSMMGAEQKAWFKAELLAAKAAGYPLIVWASSGPWIDAKTAGADTWGGYSTERKELANFMRNNDIPQLLIVSGDAHMIAIDDGTNSDYSTGGGLTIPVFHGSALDRSGSVKGGPYSHGTFPGRGHFGLVTITDDGGPNLEVRLSGRQSVGTSSQEVVSYTFKVQTKAFLPMILG